MSLARKSTGREGEEIAAAYLRKAGYRLLERNYRCRFGEIDIVAEVGRTIVFAEVKCRRTGAYGDPQLAVGLPKQKKLSLTALHYLNERHIADRCARFDVVAVKLLPGEIQVELIRNAFEFCPG